MNAPRTSPPPEYSIQLGIEHISALLLGEIYGAKAYRAVVCGFAGYTCRAAFTWDFGLLFYDRTPLATGMALSLPLGVNRAAARTAINGFRLAHRGKTMLNP